MLKLTHVRDLLLTLLVVYYAQGSLYAQGSIVSQVALAIILVVSSVFLGKSLLIKDKRNSFFNAWTFFLLLNIFGFIFTASYSNPFHFGMFKAVLITLLPFYPFYYFAYKEQLKAKHLVLFFLFMLPVIILQFYFNQNQILAERISNKTDLVNNVAYSFVALIPFVFLFRGKRIFSIAALLLLLFFVIQGAKRGALIAAGIASLFFIYYQLKTVDKKYGVFGYIITILGLIGLGVFIFDFYQSNEYLLSRMDQMVDEGSSSGRDVIYGKILKGWYENPNFINLVFGFGFGASMVFTDGLFAHNDWLELLSNFGLFGVFIYLSLFYYAARFIFSPQWIIEKRIVMAAIFSIWFFMTLISMFYASTIGCIQSILLGYVIGSKSNTLD